MKIRYVKVVSFLILVFACLEIISRKLDGLLPLEVQQKYSSVNPAEQTYLTNGRGARGQWPNSNKLQVAMIGSSILAMHRLSDQATWTTILENELSLPIHIDNYGMGFNKFASTEEILNFIKSENIHYDVIVLQMAADEFEFKREQVLLASYSSRWMIPERTLCATCVLFKRFTEQRFKLEKKFLRYVMSEQATSEPNELDQIVPLGGAYNKVRYQKLLEQDRFADSVYSPPLPLIEHIQKQGKNIFSKALSITPNVIWIPEGIGYHPQMKPSYIKNYTFLLPITAVGTEQRFMNPVSSSRSIRKINQYLRDAIKPMNITEMDWLNTLSLSLPNEDGLYIDEYHLSARGSAKVAQILKPNFDRYLSTISKNQNR